jgi:hypothetical protein
VIRPEFDHDNDPDETGDGGLFAAIGGAALCALVLVCLVALAGGAELVVDHLLELITAVMLIGVLVLLARGGRR